MNEKLPGVSVVVPVYNGEASVEETVRSLLALTYPRDRMELIVVDNASTDGTARILSQFADRIRVLTEPKRGRSYTRNRGIAAATHELVAFTDADCIADSEWLRHLVTPLADPRTGISGGKIVTKRPCTPIEEFGESLWEQNHAINVYKPPYAISANWLSPKRVLVEAGGFDAAFERGEDVDLAYRILQAGYSIAYSDNAVIQHRNPQNIEGLFKLGFLHGFYSVKVLKRHREFLQQFGHRRIYGGSYRLIAVNLMNSVRKGSDPMRLYDAVFNLGKKAGKASGSIRYGYLEL
jgi:glycosyltransferase involved in cell wall biosynthesis